MTEGVCRSRSLEWIPTGRGAEVVDAAVWVDVVALDAAWCPKDRIGPGGAGLAKGGTYAGFGVWLARGRPIEMVEICFHGTRVTFTNGRHRFAWLRDHGVAAMPVQIDPDSVPGLRRLCGSDLRRCELPAQSSSPDAGSGSTR